MTFSTRGGRELLNEPPTPDAVIAALAARQHGAVTAAQLLAAGLDHDAILRRVRAGRLHRVHHGVYAVGHAALSFEGRCMAAALACGKDAAVSHLTAATLWKVSRWPIGPLSVVTLTQHRPDGIDAHRTTRLDYRDVTTCRGIPITTVARMLVDLSDILTAHQLAWVINQAAYWHRFNLEATRQAIKRSNGRHNLRVLERAIELHLSGSAGTRSAAEDAFLESLPEHERDSAIVNTRLEVDVRWPDRKLVVEIDGEGHGRPPAKREDADRDARLRAAGWEVIRRDAA